MYLNIVDTEIQISIIFILILIVIAICIINYTLYKIFTSPFHYPYLNYYFDVSSKRNPSFNNLIDNFLIAQQFVTIKHHKEKIDTWKSDCQKKIESSILKNYRKKQFKKCLDDEHAFNFYLTRSQKRYKQSNYIKSSYQVNQIIKSFSCDYMYLFHRNEQLKSINYECTLNEYYNKNQRKLMTKKLRKKIMERDNYTCQLCGKYMPDEVGLHVDHIIPISKGGKTISSNLQVLCSKCNGKKSNHKAI